MLPTAVLPWVKHLHSKLPWLGGVNAAVPVGKATGALVEGDIEAQARRAFDNLKAVCEAAGGSFDHVVRLGLYLTDLSDFARVNAV